MTDNYDINDRALQRNPFSDKDLEVSEEAGLIVLNHDVRFDKRLSYLSRLIYGEIASIRNYHGVCIIHTKYFADLYGVTSDNILECLQELVNTERILVTYMEVLDDVGDDLELTIFTTGGLI